MDQGQPPRDQEAFSEGQSLSCGLKIQEGTLKKESDRGRDMNKYDHVQGWPTSANARVPWLGHCPGGETR